MVSEDFNKGKTLEADAILAQLNEQLAGQDIPATARRPDVRLIVRNTSDADVTFLNPGGHADKEEVIPHQDEKGKTAAMIMVYGDTLSEQQQNAATLNDRYNLAENGFTPEFLDDLRSGALSDLIKEAYGPAPLEAQAQKFESVSWANDDGTSDEIEPVKGANAAFGARPPANEQVFLVKISGDADFGFVKGTNTSAERFYPESEGTQYIAVGVSPVLDDSWKPTGEFTTKPIAPEIAKEFYGAGFAAIPVVNLDADGNIASVNLTPLAAGNDASSDLKNDGLNNG